MHSIAELVDRYIAVWNEPDDEVRRKRIAELWVEDGGTYHKLIDARGYDAIEARVAGSHEKWVRTGGFIFKSLKNVVSHHNVAKFNWEMVPARGGEAASVGFDFLILDNDGRIRFDYMFNESRSPANELNELVDRYVAAWNEPDVNLRRRRIGELWAEDGAYMNESVEKHGQQAIETVVVEAYREFVAKGFVFRSTNNADGHHNVVRFNWEMHPARGGGVAAVGFDFLVLGDDGRIRFDYQFNEPLPAP